MHCAASVQIVFEIRGRRSLLAKILLGEIGLEYLDPLSFPYPSTQQTTGSGSQSFDGMFHARDLSRRIQCNMGGELSAGRAFHMSRVLRVCGASVAEASMALDLLGRLDR